MDVEKVTEVAPEVDDDGRVRTGTVWTATTHAITAVIGSGVLALPWSVAQMGWVLGPIALIGCAYITYYTAVLLSDCYRSPDPVHGKRNYTYMDAVRSCLGPREVAVCGIAQYTILCGAIVRGAQQLPPLQGPRRGLQPGRDDVPGHVRRNRDRPVAAAEPGEGHIRLHRRRRHVLHLLLRRALPQRRQVRVQSQGLRHHLWQPYRRPRRRLRGDQDLELPSGPRQHRLRLHLRHAPHRDPGYGEGAAVGERDDEEGEPVRHRRDDGLLRVAGVHRVRGVRQRGAGEHPHRLRRAVLACGPRQHRRGRPPGRGLPGVRAARVRVLREEAPGPVPARGLLPPGARAAAAGPPGRAAVHHVQAGAAHGVRGRHDGGVAYAALLQRHPRPARRRRLLAAHRLLPGHHVHHAGQGAARQREVGGAAGAQRRRARRVAARRGGLRGRHRPAPRARHHVQDPAVIDRWTWPV